MALQDVIGQSVAGLGYEVVDVERTAALLRVTIDWPWTPTQERLVNVEDCEKVTRQLRFALEVEGTPYRRLEVSSPGIDRPLRTQADFERFEGETIDLALKQAIGAQAAGQVNATRKKFSGRLERAPMAPGAPQDAARGTLWRIVWSEEPTPGPTPGPGGKPGKAQGKKHVAVIEQAMDFRLDELKEARLAPIVDFKGRKPKAGPADGADSQAGG